MANKLTIELMHAQFVSPYETRKAEELYAEWQNQLNVKLPQFQDFDNQLNNESMTTESFREFFTFVDSSIVFIPTEYLYDNSNPLKVVVNYVWQIDGEVYLTGIYTKGNFLNINWCDELYSELKTICYAFQSKM